MTGEVPAYVLAPGREALSRRLESLAAAEVPVACGVYVNLAEPCEWSARHAEATYWIAYQLAHGSVPALPHFNTSPPPILRIIGLASRGRLDALGSSMADLPDDLATRLWRQVAALTNDPAELTIQERRRASDLMLRLGYLRAAAELLSMPEPDAAAHVFSAQSAVEELAVLVRRRHDPGLLEERALAVARDRGYSPRVRYTMANFVVVRNGKRGTDTPAMREAAEIGLTAVGELEEGPFRNHLAQQTVHRANAFVPFVAHDAAGTLRELEQAEQHQLAAETELPGDTETAGDTGTAGELSRLAWKDHAFPLYETIARTHLSLGNPTAAIAATDRLTALSPNDARAWDIRGQAFLRAGRLDEAIEAYRRAIPIGGLPVARAAFYLGWIHAQLGCQDEALSYYRLSERIDPTASALAGYIDAVRKARKEVPLG